MSAAEVTPSINASLDPFAWIPLGASSGSFVCLIVLFVWSA
jgi:hypothetical protein